MSSGRLYLTVVCIRRAEIVGCPLKAVQEENKWWTQVLKPYQSLGLQLNRHSKKNSQQVADSRKTNIYRNIASICYICLSYTDVAVSKAN